MIDNINWIDKYMTGRSVLDVGVGSTGQSWHRLIKRAGLKVVGLDINEGFVDDWSSLGYNVLLGDILSYDSSPKFDVVVSGECVEHVENQSAFFEGLVRNVRDDGLVIVTTPNANSFANTVPFWLRGFVPESFEHVVAHRLSTLENIGLLHGLRVVDVFYYNNYYSFKGKSFTSRFGRSVFEFLLKVVGFVNPKSKMVLGVVYERF